MEYIFDEYLCENIYRKIHERHMNKLEKEIISYGKVSKNIFFEIAQFNNVWIPPNSTSYIAHIFTLPYLEIQIVECKNKKNIFYSYLDSIEAGKETMVLLIINNNKNDFYLKSKIIDVIYNIRKGYEIKYISNHFKVLKKRIKYIKENYNRAFFNDNYQFIDYIYIKTK